MKRRNGLGIAVGVISIISVLPLVVIALESVTSLSYLRFPPTFGTFKWFSQGYHSSDIEHAARYSVVLTACVAVVTIAIALGIGFLHRSLDIWAVRPIVVIATSPLLIPHVLIGIALLGAASSLRITSAPWMTFLGQTLIFVPIALRFVVTALSPIPRSLEWASASLGASQWLTFRKVLFPLILPTVIGAFIAVFMLSFGEINIGLFTSQTGKIPLSVTVFNDLSSSPSPLPIAVATFVVLATILIMGIAQRRFRVLETMMSGESRSS